MTETKSTGKQPIMKFCAIICEFNPFHNGHEYVIQQAKKQLGLPVVCLMSGNFVQRGEPAIFDKFERACDAINAGASAVIELPVAYALSSAENFAYGAIKILKNLKCATLVVGATQTNIDDYNKILDIDSTYIETALKTELDKGKNYGQMLTNVIINKCPSASKIFEDASNILALEYMRQIKKQNAKIDVLLVNRTDGGYNASKNSGNFANATTIRQMIAQNKSYSNFVPAYCKHTQTPNTTVVDALLLEKLRNIKPKQLEKYYDYAEGLPGLISNAAKTSKTIEELAEISCTKRYRKARIKKLCIYPAINLTKANFEKIKKAKPVAKVLAIKNDSKTLISQFNKNSTKVVASHSHTKNLSKAQQLSLEIDQNASNLYALATSKPHCYDLTTGTIFCK